MAITINQIPPFLCVNKQRIISLFVSDNYANTGFKFQITAVIAEIGLDVTLLYSPNISGAGVFDLSPFVIGRRNDEHSGLVHNMSPDTTTCFYNDDDSLSTVTDLTATEGWIIDGVFTLDVGSVVSVETFYIGNGWFNPSLGMLPNTLGTNTECAFILDDNDKRVFSDRKWDTHKWDFATKFGFTEDETNTFIGVREEDFGVLSFGSVPAIIPGTEATQLSLVLIDSVGAAHTYVEDLATQDSINIASVYPANLNAGTTIGMPKPSTYPDWRYYKVSFLDDGDFAVSMTYVFYNADLYGQHDCNYDVVRIGWQNSRLGWDYFNFIKKSEQSLTMDRRRYHKVLGDYANASDDFTYAGFQAGLTERAVITEQFQSITSDWIQEGEYELLRSLMASRQVHWVQDDGTFLPVLLEQSDFLVRKIRNGKLYNVEFKLKYANPYVI